MSKPIFLYKDNDASNRDSVIYVDFSRVGVLQCGHYFSDIGTVGNCFSGSLKLEEIDFDNITTVLSVEDFKLLEKYNELINDLRHGTVKGDEHYLKGVAFTDIIKPVIDKLNSKENEELFNTVKEEEVEILMDEYNLDKKEVKEIFAEYHRLLPDRSAITYVYDNAEEVGQNYMESCGEDLPTHLQQYFNYEKFGEDLVSDGNYFELRDGRIVSLSY